MESLHKDVCFVKFFNVLLDVFQLLFIVLFSSFKSCSVNKPNVSHSLIATVDLVPLSLKTLPNLLNLLLG